MSQAAVDPRKGAFNPAIIVALLLVGLIAFITFFAASAYDDGPREDMDASPHALSKSAIGFAGAVRLLRDSGRSVVVARGPMTSGSMSQSLLVVTPGGRANSPVFAANAVKDFPGRVLVILPKWGVTGDPGRIGWVRKAGIAQSRADMWLRLPRKGEDLDTPRPGSREARQKLNRKEDEPDRVTLSHRERRYTHTLRAIGVDGQVIGAIRTGPIDRLQTFERHHGWVPMIVDERGRGILIQSEDRGRYALSDPDLFNTQGIAHIDNARAMEFVLYHTNGPASPVVFDVSLHGIQRSRSFLRQAFAPPFLAATLCGIAAAFLMGWHAFFRFGRSREEGREFALGKRALADNQADLIKMAGREHRMGAPYGTVIRDLAARLVGAPRDMTPDALDTFLDRLGEGGRTSWPLSTLRRDLEQAKDPAELLRAAERLHHWKTEMIRERQ